MERQKISRRPGVFHTLELQSSKKKQSRHERIKKSATPPKVSSSIKKDHDNSLGIFGKLSALRKQLIMTGTGAVVLLFLALVVISVFGKNRQNDITLPPEKLFTHELNNFLLSDNGVGGSDFSQTAPFELIQLNPVEYTIKNGDTLYDLAKDFKVTPQTLVSYNNITNARSLLVGQKILIPDIDGIPYTVKNGDSLLAIANKYNVSINDLLDANNLQTDIISAGMQLFIPGVIDDYQYKRAIGKLILWPVSGRLSSYFGYRKDPFTGLRSFHYGIDIANDTGTRINSAIDGKVVEVSKHSGFGNYIVIEDRYGLQTYYAHLSAFSVRKGQWVKQGQKIGEMGTTGRSTGPHLHFAVYKNGKAVNPMDYLH
ncbi:MAG: M23 family metallopeptidase [Spirochaetales bacterium]|nr:M23 family metallopeptidase [Spirochaetales bacterium]